jgi:fatty acid desaturase
MPHNIWVHYEHHKYPGVPFYNLEKVRALETGPKIYNVPEMCEALSYESAFYKRKAA